MRRIGLAVVLTVSLALAPLVAEAQQAGKVYRIGYLDPGEASAGVSRSFLEALKNLGYTEGRNLVIESRFADTKMDLLPRLARELVASGVEIIVTIGTPTVQVANAATT